MTTMSVSQKQLASLTRQTFRRLSFLCISILAELHQLKEIIAFLGFEEDSRRFHLKHCEDVVFHQVGSGFICRWYS